MISLAGDVRPFDRTVVEAFYSHYNLEQRGFPGWFTYGRANRTSPFILVPEDAPDPAREGYGQPDAGVDLERLLGSTGRNALTTNGPPPLLRARVSRADYQRLPEALRSLTIAN
jgi:hypothetical protein